jgi:hypothetical protein
MKNNAIKIIVFCLITLSSLNSFAQTGPGSTSNDFTLEGTEQDQAANPIDDYFLPMLLIGIVFGYRLLKQKKQLAK